MTNTSENRKNIKKGLIHTVVPLVCGPSGVFASIALLGDTTIAIVATCVVGLLVLLYALGFCGYQICLFLISKHNETVSRLIIQSEECQKGHEKTIEALGKNQQMLSEQTKALSDIETHNTSMRVAISGVVSVLKNYPDPVVPRKPISDAIEHVV